MSGFNPTPVDGTTPTPIPMSSVIVPGDKTPHPVRGGPAIVDSQSNTIADVAIYTYDGDNETDGKTTDIAVVGDVPGTKSAKLRGLSKLWNDVWDSINHWLQVKVMNTVSVSGSVSVSNLPATQPVSAASLPLPTGAAQEAGHLATIDSHTPALGQAVAGSSVPVVLTAAQQTALTPPAAITGFALEAGNLLSIKTDLDEIATDTDNLATMNTSLTTLAGVVSSSKAATKSASGDFVDGSIVAIGTTTQTKATDGSVTGWSVIQLLKGMYDRFINGTIAVTGTFWQATQPISAASLPPPVPTAGSTLIFKPIKAIAIITGTPVSVWTPAAGKKFRLLGFWVSGTNNTSIIFEDATGGTNEFLRTPFPQSVNTITQAISLGPVGYLSTAANNQLFFDVTNNCNISGYVYGLEE